MPQQPRTLTVDDWNAAKPITQSDWDAAKPINEPPPSQPPTTPRTWLDTARDILGFAKDVHVGAVKGLANTATGIGQMVLTAQNPAAGPAIATGAEQMRQRLQPTNTPQTIGYYGEQIGEFALPGAVQRRAAGAGARLLTSRLGAPPAPVASLPARMAREAGMAGGVAAAQTGDPTGAPAVTAAALGAAGPLAGRVAAAVPQRLKTRATKLVSQALDPTKERFKAIAEKLVPEMLKRGIQGSRESMLEMAEGNLVAARAKLDDVLAPIADRPVGTQQVIDAIESAKDAFRVNRTPQQTMKGYHGSPDINLDRVVADPATRQFDNGTSALGAFFSPDKAGATRYAGKSGRIYEAEIPLRKPYEMPVREFLHLQDPTKSATGQALSGEQWAGRLEELKREGAALRSKLASEGYDGVIVRDTKGNIKEIASFSDVSLGGSKAKAVVEYEPRAIRQLERLQQILSDLGPETTVAQIRAVRQAWDDVVDQAGGFAHRRPGGIGVPLKDSSEASAKREATSAIRELLAKESPDLAAVNREIHFWLGLKDVLTQTMQRKAPQSGGLKRAMSVIGGGVVGAVSGSPAGMMSSGFAGVLGAQMGDKLFKALTSPQFKTAQAHVLNKLAEGLATNNKGQILTAIARIQAGTGAQVAK